MLHRRLASLRGSRRRRRRRMGECAEKLGEDEELRLHRDEYRLLNAGQISLGQAVAANKEDIVYYQYTGQ